LPIHHVGALHVNTLDFGDETSDDAHQYQMLDFKSTPLLCMSEKGEGPPGKGILRDSTLKSNLTRATARDNKTWFVTPSGQSDASLLELDLPEGRIQKLKVMSGHNHIKTTKGIGLRTDMYLITKRHFSCPGAAGDCTSCRCCASIRVASSFLTKLEHCTSIFQPIDCIYARVRKAAEDVFS
jgi:hypothetical protein